MTINCKGKLVNLSEPKIMGILNVTPDSFYDGGALKNDSEILQKVETMLIEGAHFIDIGGHSTRPGAANVSLEEELKRTIPIVGIIQQKFPETLISIDTFRSKVAKEAVQVGACMVNDVSAGNLDHNLLKTVADLQVPYVLMHMKGTPKNMQANPTYENVILEVNQFFSEKLQILKELKIHNVILDPGFGFGKTIEHNYELLQNLDLIGFNKFPVLVGLSRKSMIYKVLKKTPKEALTGTIALNAIALLKGAKILRVHDIAEAKDLVRLLTKLMVN